MAEGQLDKRNTQMKAVQCTNNAMYMSSIYYAPEVEISGDGCMEINESV